MTVVLQGLTPDTKYRNQFGVTLHIIKRALRFLWASICFPNAGSLSRFLGLGAQQTMCCNYKQYSRLSRATLNRFLLALPQSTRLNLFPPTASSLPSQVKIVSQTIMITSAQEFLDLLESEEDTAYRAITDFAPEKVWLEIISQYPDHRQWVARNKNLPHCILSLLADDEDVEVRWWIASKRKLSLELFEKLAKDPSDSVRERIVYNIKTPSPVLEGLKKDVNPTIAQRAKERIESQ